MKDTAVNHSEVYSRRGNKKRKVSLEKTLTDNFLNKVNDKITVLEIVTR